MSAHPPDLAARLLARSPDGRRPVIMHHRWEDLLFLHWRCRAEEIEPTLPPGLSVDTFRGDAYVAITPLFMVRIRPAAVPAMPWVSFFQELNVRTYVYDGDGIPGVWFYSLDCNRLLAVLTARLVTGLRYFHAQMITRRAEWIDYHCRRRGAKETAHYKYRALGPARETEIGSLEFFLLERYYLFALGRRNGTLMRGQVAHVPYRFRNGELEQFSTLPARLDGLNMAFSSPDHVCVVDGLDVRVFAQERVGGANG